METVIRPERKKLAFFVQAAVDQFLDDLVEGLSAEFETRKVVVTDVSQVEPVMEWADICWFEWCDALAVYASRLEIAQRKTFVCRLHRYEVFTEYPAKMNWEVVDRLIVVSDHLLQLLESSIPDFSQRVRTDVVYNGVNLSRYVFKERGSGYRLAFAGFLHGRKNPTALLELMSRLVKLDPRYELHVAGRFQDPALELFWGYHLKETGLDAHVHMDGWQQNVAAWLEDKNYFVSTSLHESFGYSIAEAMAMGIQPVVLNFFAARDIWPADILFNHLDEAVERITSGSYDSSSYRSAIEARYSLDHQVARTLAILHEFSAAGKKIVPPPIFRPGALKALVTKVQAH